MWVRYDAIVVYLLTGGIWAFSSDVSDCSFTFDPQVKFVEVTRVGDAVDSEDVCFVASF